MHLDLTTLEKVIQRLQQGWRRYQIEIHDTHVRDGLIMRFQFVYELSHKMLKRHLVLTAPTPAIFETADFQFLIRSANEQGLLLSDWVQWRSFREMRSKTSHSYAEEIAVEVVQQIPAFLDEATFLLQQLQKRHQP